MTPTETERHELWKGLGGVLPEAQVKTLMESLPPVDWRELATKTDLAALEERMDLKADARFTKIDARFTEIDARFTEIDARFTEIHAKVDTGLADLNAKVDTGLADLNAKVDTGLADVRGEIKSGRATQTYVFLVGLVATMTPIYLALFNGLGT